MSCYNLRHQQYNYVILSNLGITQNVSQMVPKKHTRLADPICGLTCKSANWWIIIMNTLLKGITQKFLPFQRLWLTECPVDLTICNWGRPREQVYPEGVSLCWQGPLFEHGPICDRGMLVTSCCCSDTSHTILQEKRRSRPNYSVIQSHLITENVWDT